MKIDTAFTIMFELEASIMAVHKIGFFILTIALIPSCFFTLFLIAYYLRGRYKMYQSRIKNVNIKCIINNFILVLLLLQLMRDISVPIELAPKWLLFKEKRRNFPILYQVNAFVARYIVALNLSIVPVLCSLTNFLCLIHRKNKYKYTILIWVVYIFVRIIVILLLTQLKPIYDLYVNHLVFGLFYIFDLIQFVYYSRQFYLHLKRTKADIGLFYSDKKAYLGSRFLRIHFKTAVILLVLSLFFYSFGFGIWHLVRIVKRKKNQEILFESLNIYVFLPSRFLSKIFSSLSFLFIIIVIIYKSFKERKLVNKNNKIKPLIENYQKGFYQTPYSNYAEK